tara:strand:- start:270 stop:524 length:255 start_codon:yes stop_codon:yes gene_type:complete
VGLHIVFVRVIMDNTQLRDSENNMIFVNDRLSSSNAVYIVRFGFYSYEDDEVAYGFYLLDEQDNTLHPMPYTETGMLKLLNLGQ